MSPIGRVFIILNLILAGTFVGFAGTDLQRQHHWKKECLSERDGRAADKKQAEAAAAELKQSIQQDQLTITKLNTQVAALTNEKESLATNNKELETRMGSLQANFEALTSSSSAVKSSVEAAFTELKSTSDKAIAAEAAKDAAVREKDDAVAKHREATQKIKELTEAGEQKDLAIAGLTKDKAELGLLVDAARVKGFLDSMATPALAGTVSHVAGKLVTISVTDNANKAEIKPGFSFAIYDGSTFKGEAVVTQSDSEKNVAFCTLRIQKGDVKVGDKASTQTN